MKWDRPSLISLVYYFFTILYTLYIAHHFPGAGGTGMTTGKTAGMTTSRTALTTGREASWFYLIEFFLVAAYIYFIAQGLAFRSKNWGVVLLLPLAIWVITISVGFGLVALFRVARFNNKDRYNIDMAVICAVFLGSGLYAQKWIRPRKAKRH
jgi:NADH:ubiquinone oxidoreductase subunit K